LIISCIGTSAGIAASFLPNKKNYIIIGCDHFSFEFNHRGIYGWFLNKRYCHLNAVVSLTNEDLPLLKRINPNAYIIPNSVSFYPAQQAQLRNKIMLVACRLEYIKGLDMLLDIIETIGNKIPEWIVRICGSGKMSAALQTRIDSSVLLQQMVKFAGQVTNMEEEYQNASLYLMTSRAEVLPMVLLEAQAYGLPIVSFDCKTGPSDIVTNGQNGFLIPCFNTQIFGKRIVELCDNYSLRQQFGNTARESVKRFLPDTITNKWESLFETLING
jgi:glycosyltransferase involved in cell wall biosynthesis